jgi:hypothetical protein
VPLNVEVLCEALMDALEAPPHVKLPPPVLEVLVIALCEMLIAPFVIEPEGVYGGRFAVERTED